MGIGAASLNSIFTRMEDAARRAGRNKDEIQLLPVSKGQSIEVIRDRLSVENFPRRLGENYLQELQYKQGLVKNAEWHFIGQIQSKKIPDIKKIAKFVHTISRAKELEAFADSTTGPCPLFFLQIKSDGASEQKTGIECEKDLMGLLDLANHLSVLKNCIGLMCLPSPLELVGEKKLRQEFSYIRNLQQRYLPGGLLNMGTSVDFEIAIEEGAHWIRLGSVLFGERP